MSRTESSERMLRTALSSSLARKTTLYSAAMVANSLLGIAIYGILTRRLPVEDFGTYSFVIAFFLFTATFFDFGVNAAGMRLMATTQDTQEKSSIRGALFLLSGGLGFLYMAVVASASFVVERHIHPGAGHVLLIMAPLAAIYPSQEMVFSVAQGESRIGVLSGVTVFPRLLLTAALLVFLSGPMTLHRAVFLTLCSVGISTIVFLYFLRPGFTTSLRAMAAVLKEIKEYGRDVYTGRIVDGLTVGLDKMLLSAFHGMSLTAYYSIALTLSTPISMGSKALSHSAYKRFASERTIPRHILLACILWSVFIAIAIGLGGYLLIPLFFTDAYTPALSVLPLLALGGALLSMNYPFHAFLAARRYGKAIRLISVTTSFINVLLNIVLIPSIGMAGAALALITTYAVNIGLNLWFYRKAINNAQ